MKRLSGTLDFITYSESIGFSSGAPSTDARRAGVDRLGVPLVAGGVALGVREEGAHRRGRRPTLISWNCGQLRHDAVGMPRAARTRATTTR